VVAGVLYSLRPWPRPLHLRLPALLAGFAVMGLVMAVTAVATSLVPLILAMLVAGALITPQVTAHSLAVEIVAPAGTATEGFGWVITAATLGIAAGSSIAGVAVEQAGPPAAFLAGGVAAAAVAVLLWARRTSLVAQPAPAAAT
jgi:predicted MFS family arabinose efflux permease